MLRVVPLGLRKANAYVEALHRHHGPARGCKFCLACVEMPTGILHGVAIIGRPVARALDDGGTCEVVRLATDGTPHVPSKLYGSCRRAARELGYWRILTYTLAEEPGTSLRGAGWHEDGPTGGDSWNRPGRPRTDKAPTGPKTRWVSILGEPVRESLRLGLGMPSSILPGQLSLFPEDV